MLPGLHIALRSREESQAAFRGAVDRLNAIDESLNFRVANRLLQNAVREEGDAIGHVCSGEVCFMMPSNRGCLRMRKIHCLLTLLVVLVPAAPAAEPADSLPPLIYTVTLKSEAVDSGSLR